MDNDSAQVIVLAIILIAIVAAVFVPLIAFYIYAFYQKSKRNRIRERVLNEQRQLVGGHRWFPVRCASEIRFKAPFKLFPWEGAGIMVIARGSVLFLGQTISGFPVMLQFAPGNSRLTWLGKAPCVVLLRNSSSQTLLQFRNRSAGFRLTQVNEGYLHEAAQNLPAYSASSGLN
jgi:hypothetical protein